MFRLFMANRQGECSSKYILLGYSQWWWVMKSRNMLQILFDVHVTVHRDEFLTLNQPDALISQIFVGMKLYIFRTVPLSIIRSFSLYKQQWYMSYKFGDSLQAGSGCNCSSILILLASCQQTCMTYTIAVCTVKNSWCWTEELSKTCRI
jgi:hypothetical protein